MTDNPLTAAETQLRDSLIEVIRLSASQDDEARITMGEAASCLNTTYGGGEIPKAAVEASVGRSTLYERKRVVEYYQESAGQTAVVGDSVIRDLWEEHKDRFPLRWTHFRHAMSIGKPTEAITQLLIAVQDMMTPDQFEKHIVDVKREKGIRATRVVIESRLGYRTVITRDKDLPPFLVNGEPLTTNGDESDE